MSPRRTVLVLVLVLACTWSVHAEPDEWVRDVDEPFLTHENAHLILRVVDYWTGAPIPGARADLFWEVSHPTPGFGEPIVSGHADERGWIRVPAMEPELGAGHWVYVSAPGYAPDARFGRAIGEEVELRPPVDIHLEFRDPLERPVTDLGVSLFLGCGHAPDVRMTRSDWRGRATLHDVDVGGDGRIWFWGSRVRSEYVEMSSFTRSHPGLRRPCVWSHDVMGRVLAHDGTPAPGVAVGLSNYHRGPWTRTDAQGRFRLVGAGHAPATWIVCIDPEDPVVGEPNAGRTAIWTPIPPPDVERVIRLPAPGEDYEEETTPSTIRVRLRVGGMERVTHPLEPWVFCTRLSDGWTTYGVYDLEAERRILACPPGEYVLIACLGGVSSSYPGYATTRVRANVAAGECVEVEMELAPPRRVRLDLRDLLPDAALFLVAEQFEEPVDEDRLAEATDGILEVFVPAAGPVHLRQVDGHSGEFLAYPSAHVVEIPEVHLEPDGRPFRVPALPRFELRARFVDEQGRAVLADGVVGHEAPDIEAGESVRETLSLVVPVLDGASLWIRPLDPARAGRRIPLPSAAYQQGVVDLGDVVLSPRAAPRLRVLAGEGIPAEAVVRIVRGPHRLELEIEDESGAALEPWGPEPAIGPGARVLVLDRTRALDDIVVDWRTTLEGPGPWTIAPPTARLEIRVLDRAGQPVVDGATVHVDGVGMALGDRGVPLPIRLTGLTPGPHDVILRASGHPAQHHRVVLGAEEVRVLEVRLKP